MPHMIFRAVAVIAFLLASLFFFFLFLFFFSLSCCFVSFSALFFLSLYRIVALFISHHVVALYPSRIGFFFLWHCAFHHPLVCLCSGMHGVEELFGYHKRSRWMTTSVSPTAGQRLLDVDTKGVAPRGWCHELEGAMSR